MVEIVRSSGRVQMFCGAGVESRGVGILPSRDPLAAYEIWSPMDCPRSLPRRGDGSNLPAWPPRRFEQA